MDRVGLDVRSLVVSPRYLAPAFRPENAGFNVISSIQFLEHELNFFPISIQFLYYRGTECNEMCSAEFRELVLNLVPSEKTLSQPRVNALAKMP